MKAAILNTVSLSTHNPFFPLLAHIISFPFLLLLIIRSKNDTTHYSVKIDPFQRVRLSFITVDLLIFGTHEIVLFYFFLDIISHKLDNYWPPNTKQKASEWWGALLWRSHDIFGDHRPLFIAWSVRLCTIVIIFFGHRRSLSLQLFIYCCASRCQNSHFVDSE